jgi:cytochrome P450
MVVTGGRVCGVTAHFPPLSAAHVDLSDQAFWGWPLADRQAAFALLRSLDHPPFFAEPEAPFEVGPGYYALVRHADVVEASRSPEVFCSGKGATSVADLPVEFNEYFGSMINMDDPRHARLRRIVSRAFTPRMIQRFADDVARTAAGIVDELLATGPCDFVANVATRLPLIIICRLMGIPDDSYDMVLRNTNIILSGFDTELISEDLDEAVGQILGAGAALAGLVTALAQDRAGEPPARFDITRSPNPHVGFGAAGPHFCLGAHLARREISVLLRELLTRVPTIRAAGPPDRLLSSFINGIKHLNCDFGP